MVDAVVVAIKDGPGIVPTAKHSLGGGQQLVPRVSWYISAGGSADGALEVGYDVSKDVRG